MSTQRQDNERHISTQPTHPESMAWLQPLQGSWANISKSGEVDLPGRGWNMIALPDASDPAGFRLFMNQYNECLDFNLVDENVPNRGVSSTRPVTQTDQFIVTLDYQQRVKQIAEMNRFADVADDSGVVRKFADIHHEPGLFLRMKNHQTEGFDIARLGTIPHGNSLLALGKGGKISGRPPIPGIGGVPHIHGSSGLPIGVQGSKFLDRYNRGNFIVFNPFNPTELLDRAIRNQNIVSTVTLDFDTRHVSGGIVNIPFIEKQADTTAMRSIFWIEEIGNDDGTTTMQLQYLQVVILEFGRNKDGGPVQFPHISINTMQKLEHGDECSLPTGGAEEE